MVAVGVTLAPREAVRVAGTFGVRLTAKMGMGLIVGVEAGGSVARENVAQATRLNPIKIEKEIRRPPGGGRLLTRVNVRSAEGIR